ncbi:MAG: DUF1080 domain-containing protein, partial [Planctomycetota bacterium]
ADEFVALFDGESLDGWTQRGGKAEYAAVDGMIVGTSVAKTPNSFLCTEREYGDFVLELDVNNDLGLNSGIMIRAQHREDSYVAEGVSAGGEPWSRKIGRGRVHGYQVEVDHNPKRGYSGGIYDEARRGWLQNLAGDDMAAARSAYRYGEWNHYRIECRGDSIRTWVNGVPAADLVDPVDASGIIGLQVHSVPKPENVGKQVRWRNLRIKEI